MPRKILKKIWEKVEALAPEGFDRNAIDIWFEDESRAGQKGTLTRIWARTGTRPRVVRQQQYLNAYIIGSVCVTQNTAEAVIMPHCNTEAMQVHLEQISKATKSGRFAVVVMDQASWHTTEDIRDIPNVAPLFLPPASPELNPMEQVWEYIKDHYLSNMIFDGYEDIVESCCDAWNKFINKEYLIKSLCSRDWLDLEC